MYFCFDSFVIFLLNARVCAHPHKNVQSYENYIKFTNYLAKNDQYFLKNANYCCKTTTKFAKLAYFLYLCLLKIVHDIKICRTGTMKSLFLLIALYTITGKQAVPSGDIPAGSSCTYEQSGSRSGQMTAGNDLTLTLSGYDGMILQSVTLQMKSNSAAGGGELTMTVGSSNVWTIANAQFNTAQWAGAFTTDWVDISHSLNGLAVPDGAPIVLHISASQNSLYLQSVAVNYLAPQAEKYTVSFCTYSSEHVSPLTEEQPNAGVVLPSVPVSDAQWLFYGWAAQPVVETTTLPQVNFAGSIYYPTGNCTLYAVYRQYGEQLPWYPTDDLTLGDYLIALNNAASSTAWLAIGAVDNGMLATVQVNYSSDDNWLSLPHRYNEPDAVYTIAVTGDTLTIRHKATNTAVLLATTGKFAKSSSGNNAWIIRPCEIEPDVDAMPEFVISGTAGGKEYYVSYYWGNDAVMYFRPTTDAAQPHNLLLFALSDMVETATVYSSYAFGTAVDTPAIDYQPYTINFGSYKLIIHNGHKYLQINQ